MILVLILAETKLLNIQIFTKLQNRSPPAQASQNIYTNGMWFAVA